MKNIFIVTIILFTAGCLSSVDKQDPIKSIDVNSIVKIEVGLDNYLTDPDKPIFEKYFEINDKETIHTLFDQLFNANKYPGPYPGIGVLCDQKYIDSEGNIVLYAEIIIWDNLVAINNYRNNYKSKEYCKAIYNLLQKHRPDRIKELERFCKSIDQNHEDLLFDGKLINKAQP